MFLLRISIEKPFHSFHPTLDRRVLIAGSVGPYGAGLHDGSEYRGEYVETTNPSTIVAWHTPRVEALLDAGVDLLAIETIPALAEAELLLNLLKKYPKAKAWLAFSCKVFCLLLQLRSEILQPIVTLKSSLFTEI